MKRLGLFLYLASSTTKKAFATLSTMERKVIAVCQLTATNDKDKNFETCKSLIETAKENHAQMVFLPEACDFIGESKEETFALSEPFPGPLMQKYCQLAKNSSVWLSLGGLHEKVVDPWGVVIAQCYEGTNMALAEIDLKYLEKVRASMPVWQHRRLDLYPELVPLKNEGDMTNENTVYQFGQTSVNSDAVFYRTPYTIAFTNKKCVLPGHVLVAPIRPVKRIQDLTKHEISDLFSAVQKVQKIVENEYKANSSTIAVQDGIDAGQHVFHVHVHVIPRRPGDFKENDEIYHELEKHDKEETGWRSEAEMANEAAVLRRHVSPS